MVNLKDAIMKSGIEITLNKLKAASDQRRIERDDPPQRLKSWRTLVPQDLHGGYLVPKGGYISTVILDYCGRCQEGFTFKSDGRYQVAAFCQDCEIPRRRLKRIEQAQLPLDARDAYIGMYEFDSAHQEDQVAEFLGYKRHEDMPPSMLMHGSSGNGKTTLLYAIAKELAWRGMKVRYTTHTRLFEAEKRSWSGKDRSPMESWLDGIDVLLFDELGGIGGDARASEWYRDKTKEMLGLIYERWTAGELAVIMTTNLSPAQIVKRLLDNSQAMVSRLKSIFPDPVEMVGHDRRAKQEKTIWDI